MFKNQKEKEVYKKLRQVLKSVSIISIYSLSIVFVVLVSFPYSYAQGFYNSASPDLSVPDSRLQDPIYTDPFGNPPDIEFITPKIIEPKATPLLDPEPDIEINDLLRQAPEIKTKAITAIKENKTTIPAGLYIAVKAGINNILGIEIGLDLFNNLRIRTAVSYLFYTLNIVSNANRQEQIKVALTVFWPELIIDIYPVSASSFRFSFGVGYPGYKVEIGENASPHKKANSLDSLYIAYVNPAAPILGIGWDLGRNASYGFVSSIDMGVTWVGKPKVTRVLKDPRYDILYDIIEETNIDLRVDQAGQALAFLPWLNFTLGFKF